MNGTNPANGEEDGAPGAVFISFASADRADASKLCKAIERRGPQCWISLRDVPPGENYQEAIVQAIRGARAMVLVFSSAANSSNEIKKELSLASRFNVPVIALRIDDVEPSDAFAYELSTRQWIDAFEGWEAAVDSLVQRIEALSPGRSEEQRKSAAPAARRAPPRRHLRLLAGALLLLILGAGAWFLLRPAKVAAHPLEIRLGTFELLSDDLPGGMANSVRDEVVAAFNDDGVVGVSTAAAPPGGKAPDYVLGATIQRDEAIRVIPRLTNSRTGATLWSSRLDYDPAEPERVARRIAVDVGNVIRCGLFGASTYRKALPDAVLKDYLQFCDGHWNTDMSKGREALIPAERVVAAVPDFSWGWAAVAGAQWKVMMSADEPRLAEQARLGGLRAADRAIAIDPENSEALWLKSLLIDPANWAAREELLKRAVAARSLDCGCEHHQYGEVLLDVGRVNEAVDQLRQANDMLALYVYTPSSLAEALIVAGKPEEARTFLDAAIDLAPDAVFVDRLRLRAATSIGDPKARAEAVLKSGPSVSPELRRALSEGYRALSADDAQAKARAVRQLVALEPRNRKISVARLLGELGATREAFVMARWLITEQSVGPVLLWYPTMRSALAEPEVPALLRELGLMEYWTKSRTRPDVCKQASAPPFCRMI